MVAVNWYSVTPYNVRDTMPIDMQGVYDAWVAINPAKSMALTKIITRVVAFVRTVASNDPDLEMDPDTGKVPFSLAQHTITLCLFHLKTEMGVIMTDGDYVSFSRAEIALRQGLRAGVLDLTGPTTAAAAGSPSYEPQEGSDDV
jgi:hypothetical protein